MMSNDPSQAKASSDSLIVDRALRELSRLELPPPAALDSQLVWRKTLLCRRAAAERRATAPIEVGGAFTALGASLAGAVLLVGTMTTSHAPFDSGAGEAAAYLAVALMVAVAMGGVAALAAALRQEALSIGADFPSQSIGH